MRSADGEECERLEKLLLSKEQLRVVNNEGYEREKGERSPRWDLDPPQRENYESPIRYILALRDYANRVLASEPRPSPGRSSRSGREPKPT